MAVTAWGQVYIQATAPGEDPVQVGSLWVDTSGTATLKICTSISPYTFSAISGGGGAPDDAQYLVAAANATLTGERVTTDTTSITWDHATAAQAKAKRAALTGDVTAAADSNATTIAAGAVTEAKQTLADNTTHNASTSAHGYAPKATAPATGLLSVLGIGNGETVRTDKAIFDTTNPAALGTAAPGTALVAARRDHVHAFPTAAGYRNRLINGDMTVDQRNAGASTATADDVYCLDRWYALTQTAAVNVSRQTLQENGQPFNLRITQNQVAAQRVGVAQIIEAVNASQDRSQAMVLSARIRCSSSQAIRYAILEWTGTADAVTSDVVNDWTNGTFTAGQFFLAANLTVTAVGAVTPAANTWTDISLAGTLGASVNNVFVFIWTEGTAAQNVTLDVGLVQLERGTTKTDFEYRPASLEWTLCQRYYWKVVAVSGDFPHIGAGVGVSATSAFVFVIFPVSMRGVPTLAQSTTALYDAVSGGGALEAVTSFGTIYYALDRAGVNINASGAALAAGRATNWLLNTGGWASGNAEL